MLDVWLIFAYFSGRCSMLRHCFVGILFSVTLTQFRNGYDENSKHGYRLYSSGVWGACATSGEGDLSSVSLFSRKLLTVFDGGLCRTGEKYGNPTERY